MFPRPPTPLALVLVVALAAFMVTIGHSAAASEPDSPITADGIQPALSATTGSVMEAPGRALLPGDADQRDGAPWYLVHLKGRLNANGSGTINLSVRSNGLTAISVDVTVPADGGLLHADYLSAEGSAHIAGDGVGLPLDVHNYLGFVGVRPGSNDIVARLDATGFTGEAEFTFDEEGVFVTETDEPLARIDPVVLESRMNEDDTATLIVQLTNLGETPLSGVSLSIQDPTDRSVVTEQQIGNIADHVEVEVLGIPADRLDHVLVLSAVGNETVANGNRQIQLRLLDTPDNTNYWLVFAVGLMVAIAVGAVVYTANEWRNARIDSASGLPDE